MTDEPRRDGAPDPDLVDELLSADLDGELDAAAADHGLTPDDARALLAESPGSEARRAELATARARLAIPPAPLDELDRRRLVRAASDAGIASPTARSRRLAPLLAAAAIVVVLGVVAVAVTTLRSSPDGGGSDGAAIAPPSTTAPAVAGLDDVGDVTDPEALRALLGTAGTGFDAQDDATATAKATGDSEPLPEGGARAAPTGEATEARPVEDAVGACVAPLADSFGAEPTRLARGTFAGTEVLVVVVPADGVPTALVVDPSTCRILQSASAP